MARAILQIYIRSLFGSNESFEICIWDLLTFNELQNAVLVPCEVPTVIFQDDIEFTEVFEADDTNEQNMMCYEVLENNAIECEWQVVANENTVVNNLEGIELVVYPQPIGSNEIECLWNIFFFFFLNYQFPSLLINPFSCR